MSELRVQLDPELAALRMTARAIPDSRHRSELEGGRFALYAALEDDDHDLARRWCRTLRIALAGIEDEKIRVLASEALDAIEAEVRS